MKSLDLTICYRKTTYYSTNLSCFKKQRCWVDSVVGPLPHVRRRATRREQLHLVTEDSILPVGHQLRIEWKHLCK